MILLGPPFTSMKNPVGCESQVEYVFDLYIHFLCSNSIWKNSLHPKCYMSFPCTPLIPWCKWTIWSIWLHIQTYQCHYCMASWLQTCLMFHPKNVIRIDPNWLIRDFTLHLIYIHIIYIYNYIYIIYINIDSHVAQLDCSMYGSALPWAVAISQHGTSTLPQLTRTVLAWQGVGEPGL